MDFFLVILVFIILLSLFIYAVHLANQHIVYVIDKSCHDWRKRKIDINFDSSQYCNICELLFISGYVCDVCDIACDKQECLRIADKQLKCKQQREKNENTTAKDFKHLLIKGNLKMYQSICAVCKLEIKEAHDVGIHGQRCGWCHQSFHDSCAKDDLICDFGKLRNFILPPFALRACRSKKAPNLHLKEITPIPEWGDEWSPLIVIANSSSGANEADEVLSVFKKLLNTIQVFYLTSRGPTEALEIAKLSPVKCRIVVCGGDGTVAWVLNEVQAMGLDDKVSVSILPIGTGNDLSRTLGWKAEIDTNDLKNPFNLLKKIQASERVLIDRWQLNFKFDRGSMIARRLNRLHPDKEIFMYNYVSVGVDALVTYNFHKLRQSAFYIIKSKIMNKFLYFIYGSKEVFWQKCDGLHKELELYMDNEKIELPELQSIVVLNIDNWGAGVRLIEMMKEIDPDYYSSYSFSDGYVEVFGISSSFHIAQLQVGLTKPIKFGRAKHVKIKIKKVSPIQVDGEPFFQTPCELIITPHSKTHVLKN